MKKKETMGTHKSLGKKGGAKPGLESGVSEVSPFTAGNDAADGPNERPKPTKKGSIAC